MAWGRLCWVGVLPIRVFPQHISVCNYGVSGWGGRMKVVSLCSGPLPPPLRPRWQWPVGWFNIHQLVQERRNFLALIHRYENYQYRYFHYKDEMVVRPSCLYNWDSYSGKTTLSIFILNLPQRNTMTSIFQQWLANGPWFIELVNSMAVDALAYCVPRWSAAMALFMG